MTCRVLINPTTFEAWIKMHTDDHGKERVEILAPKLIHRFNQWGLKIPPYRGEQVAKYINTEYLTLDDLEKDPDFFTRVFKATVCKTQLLQCGYYWKDAEDYINPASEALEQDEREMQIMTADMERRKEAEARGVNPTKFFVDDLARSIVEKSEAVYLACKKTKLPSQAQPEAPSLEVEVEQSTEEMQKLTLSKRVAKTASKTHQVANHTTNFKNQLQLSSKKTTTALGHYKV
ncbi:hypothetical protein [Rhabdochlamydiaceae symbiont of Dictyostelium giganteum]|uniref:hypothetical protein n=1 Tax=Rhabdochlamydiaceae symbiont of Dictyostelium giganteum TaxID=3342349 RepID=UPI00384BE5A2